MVNIRGPDPSILVRSGSGLSEGTDPVYTIGSKSDPDPNRSRIQLTQIINPGYPNKYPFSAILRLNKQTKKFRWPLSSKGGGG